MANENRLRFLTGMGSSGGGLEVLSLEKPFKPAFCPVSVRSSTLVDFPQSLCFRNFPIPSDMDFFNSKRALRLEAVPKWGLGRHPGPLPNPSD